MAGKGGVSRAQRFGEPLFAFLAVVAAFVGLGRAEQSRHTHPKRLRRGLAADGADGHRSGSFSDDGRGKAACRNSRADEDHAAGLPEMHVLTLGSACAALFKSFCVSAMRAADPSNELGLIVGHVFEKG